MRWVLTAVLGGSVLGGCAAEPLCGEDSEGNVYPICSYEAEAEGQAIVIDYCPGDEWGAADGCNSCGCDGKGKIVCTQITCPGATTE